MSEPGLPEEGSIWAHDVDAPRRVVAVNPTTRQIRWDRQDKRPRWVTWGTWERWARQAVEVPDWPADQEPAAKPPKGVADPVIFEDLGETADELRGVMAPSGMLRGAKLKLSETERLEWRRVVSECLGRGLNAREISGEPAHRFWWWHIGLAFKGERYKGRPRTRALMIGEGIIYPLVWAGWLAFCLLGAVLTVALRSLSGLPDAGVAVLKGLAGPGYFPVLTRRWLLGWWMKYDPPEPPSGARSARRVVTPAPAPSGRTLGVDACPNCCNEVDPAWAQCLYCEHAA